MFRHVLNYRGHYKMNERGLWRKWPILLIMTFAASFCLADSSKLAKELRSQNGSNRVDVIVQYVNDPTDTDFAKVAARGGMLKKDFRGAIHGAAFNVPGSALSKLADDPNVKHVSPDRPLRANVISNNPDYYESAAFALSAWNNYTGAGIGIAVIDSGISSNADFGSRIVYNQSFVSGSTVTSDPYGHGTHVAGILAGAGNNSTGSNYTKTFIGMANGAKLINLRVLDQTGSGTDSAVISAIQKAISLKSTYNIRVINLSLGRPVYESYTLDPLCQAVESAWKAGIVVVVAAGNEGRNNSLNTNGYGTITVPGNDPYVITVGAMKPVNTPDRADDLVASYSSKGPTLLDHVVKPDIMAGGNYVISTLASTSATLYTTQNAIPTNYYNSAGSSASSTAYMKLSGTSMATPVVAGAAAILLQQTPSLTPDQVKARLMKTAYKVFPQSSTAVDPTTGKSYTSQYDIFTVGAGYLSIQDALLNTDLAPSTAGSALSPTVTRDANGNVVLVGGSSVIWGGSVTWGTSVVWGTSVIWGTNTSGQSVIWGGSVVWGTSSAQGYSVIWGTSVVWGTSNAATEATSVAVYGEN